MLNRLWQWIDKRSRLGPQIKDALDEELPPGVGWLDSLGSCVLILLLIQMLTGIFLALNYSASPDHAHDSVQFIMQKVAFGRLVRGLHYWGANAIVILLVLHLLTVFFRAAYKYPREMTWMAGSVLLLTVFGFLFTGYLLPWDQKAYWATVVGTNVAGETPLIGAFVRRVLLGGQTLGAATLSRFFAFHVLCLPAILLTFISIHLFFIRRLGPAGVSHPEKIKPRENRFHPQQTFRDAAAILGCFAIIFILAASIAAPLEARANPTITSYVPRPEWYFLFLFQLFHYFEGPLEPLGTVILPGIAFLVLFLYPLLDRNPERGPDKRKRAIVAALIGLAAISVLTYLGATAPAPGAVKIPAGGNPLQRGKALFQAQGCSGCHKIAGVGGTTGPALDGVAQRRSAAWIVQQLKDPKVHDPKSVMPSYAKLPKEDLQKLVAYLQSRSAREGAALSVQRSASGVRPSEQAGVRSTGNRPLTTDNSQLSTAAPGERGLSRYGVHHMRGFGRTGAIGFFANTHILFAAFLLGGGILALIAEWWGVRRKDRVWDDLARGIVKIMVILFSTGATLGVVLVVVLTGLFPRFWSGWLNLFFWVAVAEGIMFFLEAASLYTWYYSWQRLAQRRRLHLFLGWINVISGTATMVLINPIAAGMLTPPRSVLERPWSWATMFLQNPTFLPLTIHRFFGNISFTGLLLAAWGGIAYLRARTEEQRRFRDRVGHWGLLWGLGGLALMPVIGVFYVLEIRAAAPGGFANLMLNRNHWIFNVQIFLLAGLFVFSCFYLWLKRRAVAPDRLSLPVLIVLALAALLAVIPYNPGLSHTIFLGHMRPFKYLALSIFAIASVVSLALHWRARKLLTWGTAGRGAQYLLIAAAVFGVGMMNIMGLARERARKPYLVYGQVKIAEETQPAGPFGPAVAAKPQGASIFAQQGCSTCHRLQGKGGATGPALDDVGDRRSQQWILAQLQDPKQHNPQSVMPSYRALPEDQLEALAEFLSSRK